MTSVPRNSPLASWWIAKEEIKTFTITLVESLLVEL